jgi:predicted nucleic acid-binding protein
VNGFLVDTNVISEFTRPQPDSRVVEWLEATAPNILFASVVTYGEIRLGIEELPLGRRRAALEQWLEEGLPDWVRFESAARDETHHGPMGKAYDSREETRRFHHDCRWPDRRYCTRTWSCGRPHVM